MNNIKKVKDLNNVPNIIGEWRIIVKGDACDSEYREAIATIEYIGNKYIITTDLKGLELESTELTLTKDNDVWFLAYRLKNNGGLARLMCVQEGAFFGSFFNLEARQGGKVSLLRKNND